MLAHSTIHNTMHLPSNLKQMRTVNSYCRCPDDGREMVQCDSKMCKDWLHIDCTDMQVVSLTCQGKQGK